jgi:hypothetical protein
MVNTLGLFLTPKLLLRHYKISIYMKKHFYVRKTQRSNMYSAGDRCPPLFPNRAHAIVD